MTRRFTLKRAIKELNSIIDVREAEYLVVYAQKAAKELGFSWEVFKEHVVVQDASGVQTIYTHIKTKKSKQIQGLLLAHAMLKHKLH